MVLQNAEAVTGTFETAGFTAAVKLHGRLDGVVFYEFPEGVRSLSPQVHDSYAPFGRDYLAGMSVEGLQEIVGAMSEAAAARLATVGYASELTKPLFMGAGATIAIKKTQMRAHFDSRSGGMTIRIEISEATDVANGG